MITVYTIPGYNGTKTCRWLKERNFKYSKKIIDDDEQSKSAIRDILRMTLNGFDDIVSRRALVIKNSRIDFSVIKTSEMIDFIVKNPTCLKRPIVIDTTQNIMKIGYCEEEYEIFLKRRLRQQEKLEQKQKLSKGKI